MKYIKENPVTTMILGYILALAIVYGMLIITQQL